MGKGQVHYIEVSLEFDLDEYEEFNDTKEEEEEENFFFIIKNGTLVALPRVQDTIPFKFEGY